MQDQNQYMQRALELAKLAEENGEVPVGAVVVFNQRIIGEGWNQVITRSDPTAHAEIVAIRQAAASQENYRLPGCELYVTIEPCTMCFGTLVHSRIGRVVYGAREPRAGVLDSNKQVSGADIYNHSLLWEGGVLEEECSTLISGFFRNKRTKTKPQK